MEKSISPQRIQQAMKRGSNQNEHGGLMVTSQGGMAIFKASGSNYSENTNFQKLRGPASGQSMINDSS